MRKILYFTFIIFTFLSCKEDETIEKVIIYDYGRSEIGTTFDIPIKFIIDEKTEAIFRLYSYDQNLEAGIYQYNDKDVKDCRMWGPFNCKDKTFFKDRCKWGSSYVTGGYVSVEKEGEIYTFVVSVQTTDGIWHDWQYNGKVKKQDWHEKSKIKGMFVELGLDDYKNKSPYLYPNYTGGVTMLSVEGGDASYCIRFFFIYMHENPDTPTGTYSITGDNIIQRIYLKSIFSDTYTYLVSGTFTVTRVDKPHKYRVDIDVVDENGRVIQGCFDGGHIISDYE